MLRLESILGHCERHALLHMAPKWFDHWTTWAGQTDRHTHTHTHTHTLDRLPYLDHSCFLKRTNLTSYDPS